MPAALARIYRYPVKGLGPEPLLGIAVVAGDGLPGDRRFAIARGGTAYDDARPQWMRKESFVMLMREGDERLVTLACSYDEDARVLVMTPRAGSPCRVDLGTVQGRAAASEVLNAVLGPRADGPVRVVSAGSLSFTDIPQNGLSLANLASVADFAARIGRPLDPMRFRANLYVAGLPAWAEREWIGRTVRVGEVELAIGAHIHRCNATRVNPDTGTRDLDTLRLLQQHYRHADMGVYAEVVRGGQLRTGDLLAADASTAMSSAPPGLHRVGFYAKNAWILARAWLGR